jgi:hypothetical protein
MNTSANDVLATSRTNSKENINRNILMVGSSVWTSPVIPLLLDYGGEWHERKQSGFSSAYAVGDDASIHIAPGSPSKQSRDFPTPTKTTW